MSTEEENVTSTKTRKHRRKRRRRKKNTTNIDDNNDDDTTKQNKKIQNDTTTTTTTTLSDPEQQQKQEQSSKTDKKKHRGYRKRRRKKKKKGEAPSSPRLDELLRVAESLHHRQQMFMQQRGPTEYSPFWFQLDATTTREEEPEGIDEHGNNDDPKDLSWLAQRAALAGMGITPIETNNNLLNPPRRISRVNSWGRHTTSLDPIYNKRKGSNDSEKISRLLSGRYTSVEDLENDQDNNNEMDEVKTKAGFSSTHLEQIFSPSWGEETEAWQRERLKQWVIWAEEQERTARVRETYAQNDTVKTSSHTKLEYVTNTYTLSLLLLCYTHLQQQH
jgi:hypothetical protein